MPQRGHKGSGSPRKPSPLAESLSGAQTQAFRKRLQEELARRDWDQKRLAQESGVSESVVSRLSEGMTLWAAIAMVNALGMKPSELLDAEQPKDHANDTTALQFGPHEDLLVAIKKSNLLQRLRGPMRELPEEVRKAVFGVAVVYGYPLELVTVIAQSVHQRATPAQRASLEPPEWFGRIRDEVLSRKHESGTRPSARLKAR
jgi:DNA-binding Xre family transcriptional regulator